MPEHPENPNPFTTAPVTPKSSLEPVKPAPVPVKSFADLSKSALEKKPEVNLDLESIPAFVLKPSVFVVGDRVALVGQIVEFDHGFGRYTVRLDTPGVGDNPFEIKAYARNLRKES